MSDPWLKRAIMAAMVLLVLHGVGAWAYAVFGVGAAVGAACLVCAVSLLSARMAFGAGNNAWFVVPTLMFTALPLAGRLWRFLTEEQSWWLRTVEFAPFLFGFAVPVLLLLAIYFELGRRAVYQTPHPLPLGSSARP